MTLDKKSLTELRAIYQSFGTGDLDMSLDKPRLMQEIERKKREIYVRPEPMVKPLDGRLAFESPACLSSKDDALDVLKPYIERGLKVTFPDDDHWAMSIDKKTDEGTLRMPLRVVELCARRLMQPDGQ